MSGEGCLPGHHFITLLKGKVRDLFLCGTKYKSTVSQFPTVRDPCSGLMISTLAHQPTRVDSIELQFTANAIRPVNRLPTEILIEIFALLHPRLLRRYLPLIHATHVCRHWRNVISSTPSNWTWINPQWVQLLPLSLRLSGSAPIDVEVSDHENFSSDFVDLLLPHGERVATFTSMFPGFSYYYQHAETASKLRSRLPNLRLLSVITGRGLSSCSLPFLSGDMPHLENITLSFLAFGDQILQLTHLTTINITVERSTLKDVAELFVNNPKLKSATLCGSFSGRSCQRGRGTIRMNSLRQLDLLSSGVISLLPLLALEKGAHIRVSGPTTTPESAEVRNLFPSDITFLPNLVGLKQLRLHFMARDVLVEFVGSDGSFSILLPNHGPHTFNTDSLPLGEVEELYCQAYGSLGPAASMDSVIRPIIEMIPAMSHLCRTTFVMCTELFIHRVLSNLNLAAHLKNITISHCDITYSILHPFFAKRRIPIGDVRVICSANSQWPQLKDPGPLWMVKSFMIVHQSPLEIHRMNFEIRREFPASIRKTYSLCP